MVHHKHIMVRALVRNPVKSEAEAIEFLENLVPAIDMKIIKGPFAQYVDKPGNRGLTAVVMIETSHIAFHIWDEQEPGLLQFDLYTCGELDKDIFFSALENFFDIESGEWKLFDRAVAFLHLNEGSLPRPH